MVKTVLNQGHTQAYVEDKFLKVVEPVRAIDSSGALNGSTGGAVVLYLPTNRLQAAIERQISQSIVAALAILLAGVVMSIFMSRAVTRPLDSFREAAASVHAGGYQPDLLSGVVTRKDELGKLGLVFDQMAREVGARDRRLNLLRVIIPMGVALSAEKDFSRLLETIVIEAERLTNADAGSLYLLTDDNMLKFVIVRNQTLEIALGGTTGKEMTLQPIPLYDEQGHPNHNHIASYCALTGKSVSIENVYTTTEFDLSGTRAFDTQTGYHSKSVLTMPLKDTSNNVIGVLQLLNAKDHKTKEVVHFQEDEVVDSLALITSAALTAYIREETLREEINKLRIEIDHSKQNKQVDEIAESDYFKNLQAQAALLRKKRKS
jgi:HAMP domain-containing protein